MDRWIVLAMIFQLSRSRNAILDTQATATILRLHMQVFLLINWFSDTSQDGVSEDESIDPVQWMSFKSSDLSESTSQSSVLQYTHYSCKSRKTVCVRLHACDCSEISCNVKWNVYLAMEIPDCVSFISGQNSDEIVRSYELSYRFF